MVLWALEQMAHLARTLVELAQKIIGLQRDSGVGAELEQSWSRDGMRLTSQPVEKSASAMLPPMPTTSARPKSLRWRCSRQGLRRQPGATRPSPLLVKTRGLPAGVEERSAGLTKFPSTLAPNSKRSKRRRSTHKGILLSTQRRTFCRTCEAGMKTGSITRTSQLVGSTYSNVSSKRLLCGYPRKSLRARSWSSPRSMWPGRSARS